MFDAVIKVDFCAFYRFSVRKALYKNNGFIYGITDSNSKVCYLESLNIFNGMSFFIAQNIYDRFKFEKRRSVFQVWG